LTQADMGERLGVSF